MVFSNQKSHLLLAKIFMKPINEPRLEYLVAVVVVVVVVVASVALQVIGYNNVLHRYSIKLC